MTEKTESLKSSRSCKVCGTPAGDGTLCERCGAVLQLPDEASLVEDEGAAVRRDFEGRGGQPGGEGPQQDERVADGQAGGAHRATPADPASASEQPAPLRAVRHLRHMRAFYGAGVALWMVSTAWTAWDSPGSRPMWTSVLLFVVFTGLLALATVWLRRLEDTSGSGSARHAAQRAPIVPRVRASHS
ncbi:hypothetical protein ABZT04_32710 [Streptomyces sp. NPDC005492]|uniref:hypothetical protein n=1 Tax=Streptomyces sp. NPDC005492 TaxID=3156883 RepID=UPI0033B7259A